MNLFKNLMFLQGHFTDPHMDDGYGEGYGNRIANARVLRGKSIETRCEPAGESEAKAAGASVPEHCCE